MAHGLVSAKEEIELLQRKLISAQRKTQDLRSAKNDVLSLYQKDRTLKKLQAQILQSKLPKKSQLSASRETHKKTISELPLKQQAISSDVRDILDPSSYLTFDSH